MRLVPELKGHGAGGRGLGQGAGKIVAGKEEDQEGKEKREEVISWGRRPVLLTGCVRVSRFYVKQRKIDSCKPYSTL